MTYFHVISIAAVLILMLLFFLVLAEPGLKYRLKPIAYSLDSNEFLRLLALLVNSPVFRIGQIDVLSSGKNFYAAELSAIANAKQSIHIEAYLFLPSPIADRIVSALIERVQAGVQVRVVIDAIGSIVTPDRYFTRLRAAGGQVMWYQPIRWYTLKRFNNRTHRELIIIDGSVGFIGGAGIADYWVGQQSASVPWRDTMLRITGELVHGLQSSFLENWLECTGEILSAADDFPPLHGDAAISQDRLAGLVVSSTPSAGRSTRARILFQVLIASAKTTIQIGSPYFVPDASMRRELATAVARGVKVTVLVPGKLNNHPIARRASRRRYGELLRAGVEINEYEPGMIHTKVVIIDGTWSVIGSTNFDSRLFALNHEVNVVLYGREIATRLQQDFERDLLSSEPVTLAQWSRRPVGERVLAFLGGALERQE